MTVYFVSRHPGACEWITREGKSVDEVVSHLDIARVRAADIIIGSLPINLAAEVCALGARYFHLSMDLPEGARGLELTEAAMRQYGARVEEYRVARVTE